MKPLLVLHLVFAGLWIGCVLTEALFERALLGQGPESELLLARLHKRVDVFVEVPAFLAVLVTGGLMLAQASPSPWLMAKIGAGALAIAANVWCVVLVFKRLAAAQAQDWAAFSRLDHWQHKIGAIVLVGLLTALAIPLRFL